MAACIGGALQHDRYRETIEAAGFEIETWRQDPKYRFVSERADSATRKYGVTSISLLSGRMTVRMNDGAEHEYAPNEAFNIPPGHDAWTVGDEPCVLLDFGGLKGYAQQTG